jgi:hypothetical protein
MKKQTSQSKNPQATLLSQAQAARKRVEAAKKVAREAKEKSKEARRQYKHAKKEAREAKEAMGAIQEKLKKIVRRSKNVEPKQTSSKASSTSPRKKTGAAKTSAANLGARKTLKSTNSRARIDKPKRSTQRKRAVVPKAEIESFAQSFVADVDSATIDVEQVEQEK